MGRFQQKLMPETERVVEVLRKKGLRPGKDYVDWRLPKNRRELFRRYMNYRVLTHDLDHTYYLRMCALRKDYDVHRRAQLGLLFGCTYRVVQAYAFNETLPEIHKESERSIKAYVKDVYHKITVGTDARYNRGFFDRIFLGIREWLGGKSVYEKLTEIVRHQDPVKNFWALYKEIQSIYKFGRMTGWLAMQGIYDLVFNYPGDHELAGYSTDPQEILLEGYSPNNDSSLQSIWNGLCALENRMDMMTGKKYAGYICKDEDILWGRQALHKYTTEACHWGGYDLDAYRKESIWCQYKRLFLPFVSNQPRPSNEYPGHASGDAISRYIFYRDNWPEVDWSPIREAYRSQPGLLKGQTFVPWKNQVFGETGLLLNMHEMFPDMPNANELLEIDMNETLVRDLWLDDGLQPPSDANSYDFYKELWALNPMINVTLLDGTPWWRIDKAKFSAQFQKKATQLGQ